ncbi:MAG: hypothetical protein RL362_387, partial [Bacteroidota bacterium]
MKNLKSFIAFMLIMTSVVQMNAQGEFSSFTITGHGLGT